MAKKGSNELTILKKIPVANIKLDLENPRYYEARIESGVPKWTDKALEEYILSVDDVSDIIGSIKSEGVKDPVWVHEIKKDHYVMVEGSRRLVVLRKLKDEKPPEGISYEMVNAHVFLKDTDPKIIDVQKVILQTGKKKWGAFNEAKAIHDLIHKDHYTLDEVSKIWKKSRGSIEKEMENFKYFKELSKYIKTNNLAIQNPRYYSYFQKASIHVRNRFFGTKETREQFYKLILPNKIGKTKIASVALKGGLIKAFNKFSPNEIILRKFMNTPNMTADEALLEFKGGNIGDEFPWTKKLKEIATGINKLSKEDIKKIQKDKMIFNYIKKIHLSTKEFVDQK